MHEWGDLWFQQYGDQLYDAISYIDKRLWRLRIGCLTKEKWGSRREDLLRLWNGGLYTIIYGPRLSWSPYRRYKIKWFNKLVIKIHKLIYTIDHHLIPYKKTNYGRLYVGLADFNRLIKLVSLVNKWQAKQYNKTFQLACKKYPDVIEELIVDSEGYMMIKPCKWGNVDGEAIHKKYWKTL